MSFRIQCPYCSNIASLHDRFSGTTLSCPKCENRLTIPPRHVREAMKRATRSEPVEPVEEPVSAPTTAVKKTVPTTGKPTAKNTAVVIPAEPPKSKRRSPGKKGGHDDHEEAWDITPMVDVAFLLLIFFMVTASFTIEKVIRTVPEPEKKAGGKVVKLANEEEVENIIIQVDENNCYSLIPHDGDRIDTPSRQELLSNLRLIRRADDDVVQKIAIQAHEDSNHGAIVGAMDAAREATFTHIDFKVVDEFL